MPNLECDLEYEIQGTPKLEKITVEFSAFCKKCGAHICSNVTQSTDFRGMPAIEIAPCEKCLERAADQGSLGMDGL